MRRRWREPRPALRLALAACLPALAQGARVSAGDVAPAELASNGTGGRGAAESQHALCRMSRSETGFEVSTVVRHPKHRQQCAATCSRINGWDLRNKIMPSLFAAMKHDQMCVCFLKENSNALFRYPKGNKKCNEEECWAQYEHIFNVKTEVVDLFKPGMLKYTCNECETREECEPVVSLPSFETDDSDGGVEFVPDTTLEEPSHDDGEASNFTVFPAPFFGEDDADAPLEPSDPEKPCGSQSIALPLQCKVSPGPGGLEWQDQVKQGGCRGNLMALAFPGFGDEGSAGARGAYIGLRLPQTHDISWSLPSRPVPLGLTVTALEGDPQRVIVSHQRKRKVRIEVIANGQRVVLPQVRSLWINRTRQNVTLAYHRPPGLDKITGEALLGLGLKHVLPGTWVQQMRYHAPDLIDVAALPDRAVRPCADESSLTADEADETGGKSKKWWKLSYYDQAKQLWQDPMDVIASLWSKKGYWLFGSPGSDVEFGW